VNATRLSRHGADPAPVRIIHLGLGNFARAHQAWYTQASQADLPVQEQWGIAAFSGRSHELVDQLQAQGLLYTLLVAEPDGPRPQVIDTLSAAHPGEDLAAWRRHWSSPRVGVVTLTVTEAGYRGTPGGGLDLGAADVTADVEALRADPAGAVVSSVPGRLVAGLLARRDAGAGPIAVVPCDNLPANGAVVRQVVLDLAAAVDPTLAAWVDRNVSWVTTMVDRITPRTTPEDITALRERTGVEDPAAVVTEPFHEWVLSGDFPAGRPAWERAGARLVQDVVPYEHRKLWLLNGAHSLLAYAGSIRGHTTVSEAIGDEVLRGWVQQWWDVAGPQLPLPAQEVADYRSALLERFANPAIRHLLTQIAADGSQKIPVRIAPALTAQAAAGGDLDGAARPVAAWIAHARGHGAPLVDAHEDKARALVEGTPEQAVDRVVAAWALPEQAREVLLRQLQELTA
jgi:fructuronate reductase